MTNSDLNLKKRIENEKNLISIILNYKKFKDVHNNLEIYNKWLFSIFKNISPKYLKDSLCSKIFIICREYVSSNLQLSSYKIVEKLEKDYDFEYSNALKNIEEIKNREIICSDQYCEDMMQSVVNSGKKDDIKEIFNKININLKKDSLDAAYKELEQLFEKWNYSNVTNLMPIKDAVQETLKRIESFKNNNDFYTGISSGYNNFDSITKGFQNGNFIILAARPSFGKTALAINFIKNAILKNKLNFETDAILFLSLEMNNHEIIKRFLASFSSISINKIELGKLSKDENSAVIYSANQLEKSPLIINQSSSLTIDDITLMCKELSRRKTLKFVVIDYLQLIDSKFDKNATREQQVSNISRKLKLLANSLNCPVLALSQLSRKTESRENKIPLMSDLRESGSLEQDADLIMFLYRENYYSSNKDNNDIIKNNIEEIDLLISKNRHGRIGDIKLTFSKNTCRFVEVKE